MFIEDYLCLAEGPPLPKRVGSRYPCNIRLTNGCWKGVKIKCSYYSAMTPAPIIQIKSMRIMPTASALKIKEYTIRMPRSSVLL